MNLNPQNEGEENSDWPTCNINVWTEILVNILTQSIASAIKKPKDF